jgi:hypothetical protein
MRSRPDPVSGTTSIRPSAASTEHSPVQPLSPSFATECSTKTSDGQSSLPGNHAWSFLAATGV